jgi:hypothetical protein
MPYEATPGEASSMTHKGEGVELTSQILETAHIGYVGSSMPPPDAVKSGKVEPLSDEDRRTLVRWIDLGCPIDLQAQSSSERSDERSGWHLDDQRPTLTLTSPAPGANKDLSRILIGMHDYHSGLDLDSFRVVADFPINDVAAGDNLAPRFQQTSSGIWELKLAQPVGELKSGKLTALIKDQQGNVNRIERTISVEN